MRTGVDQPDQHRLDHPHCARHKFNLLHLYWRRSQAYKKSCDEDDSLVGLPRARPRRLAGHRRVDAL